MLIILLTQTLVNSYTNANTIKADTDANTSHYSLTPTLTKTNQLLTNCLLRTPTFNTKAKEMLIILLTQTLVNSYTNYANTIKADTDANTSQHSLFLTFFLSLGGSFRARMTRDEALGTTLTLAWRFWMVSLTVIFSPFHSWVALAMSSPTFLGDCVEKRNKALDSVSSIMGTKQMGTPILSHSERRHQNIYFQEKINLYCIIELATEISLFSLQISQNLMFCVDKIKYEHLAILSHLKCCQFAPIIVIFKRCICCQFEDLQIISPKIIPEPSQHLTDK